MLNFPSLLARAIQRVNDKPCCHGGRSRPSLPESSSVGPPPLLGLLVNQNQNYNCHSVYNFSACESSCQLDGARVTRGHGVGGTTNGTETQWSSRNTCGDMVSCQNRQIPLLCLPAFKNLKAMRWGQDTAVSVGICRRQQTL